MHESSTKLRSVSESSLLGADKLWQAMQVLTAPLRRLVPRPWLADGEPTAGAAAPLEKSCAQHLREQIASAHASGLLHAQGAEIASRALAFCEIRVAQLMVPRHRVLALPLTASDEQLRRLLLEERLSRVPVYEHTLDRVVGILVAKDALALAWQHQLIVLQDLLLPPYFAPESMLAADLLRELQRRQMHFAVVVDEMGQTAGIITLEDLLEELVGEIADDHPVSATELIQCQPDGSITVEGIMPVREANRELCLALPEGDAFTTMAGLCLSLAGRIPDRGQHWTVGDGTRLEVVEASARSVTRVRLALPGGAAAPRRAPQHEMAHGSL